MTFPMARSAQACLAAFFTTLAAAALAQPITTYRGICNASAGVDLGDGHFVVADDEVNSLAIYQYGVPRHVGWIELRSYLKMADGDKRNSDLEGAARVGDLIYWIG